MVKFLLSLFLCVLVISSRANILTVSKSTSYPAQYATIVGAVTAASAGDTIYIYPSGESNFYNETVTIDKRLTLIGGGPYSDRVSKLGTWVNVINISSTNANGSVIMGIGLVSMFYIGNSNNNVIIDNIIISDCRLREAQIAGNNLLFENCLLQGNYTVLGNIGALNIIFRNNIINSTIAMAAGVTGLIENNVFASRYAGGEMFSGDIWGSGVTIKNNIFYKVNIYNNMGVTALCPYVNNIYFLSNTNPPANAGSSGNLNADPQFVNFPSGGGDFNITHNYHLLPSSPGINYGTDGKDVGAWSGASPINAYFESPLPRVVQIVLSNNTVPAGGQVQITIKATKAQ